MKNIKSLVILVSYFEDEVAFMQLILKLKLTGVNFYLVVVDDGSIKKKLTMEKLSQTDQPGTLIQLKRNSGPQRAIAVGLTYINYEIEAEQVLIMDSDGEDQPENISTLLNYRTLNPNIDIIVASRLSRKDPIQFKVLYSFYKFLFLLATGKIMNFGHFSIISKDAVSRIINYPELWLHLGSTYILSKLDILRVPLPKGNKYDDRPGSGRLSLISHGIRSIIALSELMISRIFIMGFMAMTILGVVTLWSFIAGGGIDIYLGIVGSILILLNTSSTILFLGLSRNAGEYGISNYQQLIEESFDF